MENTLFNRVNRLMPEMRQLLWEHMEKALANPDWEWMFKAFNWKTADQLFFEVSSQRKSPNWGFINEGAPFPKVQWDQPTDQTFNLKKMAAEFDFTREWMEYGHKDKKHALASFDEFLADFMESGFRTIEERLAALLLDAFTGNLLTCPDGFPLVYDAHVHDSALSATFDNELTDQLDYESLGQISRVSSVKSMQDSQGRPMVIRPDTIFYGPYYDDTIKELFLNQVKPGASNSELNIYRSQFTNLVRCPWLADVYQSGADKYWFWGDSRRMSLEVAVAEMPHLLDPHQSSAEVVTVGACAWWEGLFRNWHGFGGSQGTT